MDAEFKIHVVIVFVLVWVVVLTIYALSAIDQIRKRLRNLETAITSMAVRHDKLGR